MPTVVASTLAPTASLAPTVALGTPTAVLDPTAVMAPTAVLAPTEAHTSSATEVLPGSPAPSVAADAGPTPRIPIGRRTLVAAIVAALVVLLAVIVVPRLVPANDAPATVQELPANEGDLGVHLEQLFESVTP